MYQPSPDDVKSTVIKAITDLGENSNNCEIAFFGGSFTAVDRKYMVSLLEAVKPYLDNFKGIRISTRPDYINDEVLSVLKSFGVTTIELGAQSMDDEVLKANNRGHNSQDVINASELIKKYSFNLGLQMMTGLYKSFPESDLHTAKEFIKLNPDCVRIYPTVIMKDTALADLYNSGEYKPYTLEQSVELCSDILLMFEDNGIDVIRVGLHYSDSLISGSLGGNYHPAFKELCENKIFLNKILKSINNLNTKDIILTVNPSSVSKLIGQNKVNINTLSEMGYNVRIEKDDKLGKYDLLIK